MSIISAHNVCHNICLGIIAILTIFGITVAGMPLGFLQDYNLLFWNMATFFLVFGLVFYIRNRKCMSHKMLIFNSGLIVSSVPFEQLQSYNLMFYIFGGILVLISIILYIKDRRKKWTQRK
ncbi:MAG: hypothetical protein AB1571_00470 [Nanoarchaeota archaeon]